MAAYKDLFGQKITKVTSNPGEPKTGQMWYNSTTGTLKGIGIVSAYSSGGSLTTGRRATGGTGTKTAALVCSGQISPGAPNNTNSTEEYNGTGYSTGGNTGTARYTMACGGTQTAAIISMGYSTAALTATEEYNGSSWTSGTASNDNRTNLGSGGTQSSFLAFGGSESPGISNATEEWDDSSWTSGGNLGTARYQLSGNNVGTQTASLCVGGYSGSAKDLVEEYNGSTWSTGGALPSVQGNAARGGTQTAAYIAGGGNSPTTASKHYDGTSWTIAPSLAIGRSQISGSQATQTNHVVFGGGSSPTPFQATEEFNTSINTVTAAAWSSGGSMNTARAFLFGLGPQTAALGAGGYISTFAPTANSEEYDGTSWTEGNNLNTARYGLSGFGTQTAAVAVGGYNLLTNNEHYDGSSWTNATAYPVAINYTAGAGTQTAGVAFGGAISTGRTAQTSEYDGSSWTTAAPQNLNTARSAMGSGGTQTAAIGFGGSEPAASNKTETYNGSTWTVGGTLINSFPSRNTGGGGPNTSTTDILAAGGPPHKTEVEGYDGSAWSTRPALALGRSNLAGGSTSSSGVVFGGDSAPEVYTAATEEFTGETETANVTDFTTS